jgi:hypothetical protein
VDRNIVLGGDWREKKRVLKPVRGGREGREGRGGGEERGGREKGEGTSSVSTFGVGTDPSGWTSWISESWVSKLGMKGWSPL